MVDFEMRERIAKILMSTLVEIIKINNLPALQEINEESGITGERGLLDSLAFISFLVGVEQKINKEFDKSISLISEKAFSQAQSPFRSIRTLTEYIISNL